MQYLQKRPLPNGEVLQSEVSKMAKEGIPGLCPFPTCGIYPQTKMLLWELWDPAPYTKNIEKSLATLHYVTCLQILVLAVIPAVAHELALVPLSCHLGSPGNLENNCLRQSPTDKMVFVEVQVSRGEVLGH